MPPFSAALQSYRRAQSEAHLRSSRALRWLPYPGQPRLAPRRLQERAAIALWLKEIAPSAGLRKWFGHEPVRWPEFQKRYRQELRAKPNLALQIRQLEKEHHVVTLLFGARDEEHNQAVVLRDFLAARKLGKGA